MRTYRFAQQLACCKLELHTYPVGYRDVCRLERVQLISEASVWGG